MNHNQLKNEGRKGRITYWNKIYVVTNNTKKDKGQKTKL